MIAVVGAGSMGSMVGGMLARAGEDVVLVDVDVDHVAAVAADGLEVRTADGSATTVRPRAVTDPAGLSGIDRVVVLTKSWATRDAARRLRPALTDDAVVASLQNGLGNDVVLAEELGEGRALGGTTTAGAELVAPGVVELSPITSAGESLTECAPVRPGLLDADGLRERAEGLAGTLTAAGLPTRIRTDLGEVVWTKLCLAATAAPLTAALRCTVADLLSSPTAARILEDLFDEVVAVARAEGVELDRAAVWQHAVTTFTAVGPHATSMAVDVARGRRTEIDAMCLAIAARGRRHGVATPTHEVVGRMIVAYEEQRGLRAQERTS